MQRLIECKGHTDKIRSLVWQPRQNDQILSSCSKDGTIVLWDVKSGQKARETERKDRRNYEKHQWNAEGTVFASYFENGEGDSVVFFDYRTCKVMKQWEAKFEICDI